MIKKKQTKQSESSLKTILNSGNKQEIRALFAFDSSNSEKEVLLKFNLWGRYFLPAYYKSKDASFHKDIDSANYKIYKGENKYFVDIIFRGGAKRQPLDAKIMTPTGYTTMGELKLGDFVIGSDGKPTKIEFMSEVVDRPIYKIETEDGRKTECDSEHLWTVRKMSNVKEKMVTIDTQKMIDDGLFYERVDKRYTDKNYKEYKFALETVKPIELDEKELLLDPYLVGILLGDGSMSKEWGGARLHFHKDDDKHYRGQLKDYVITDTKYDKRNFNIGRFGISNIGQQIIKLGMNVNCYDKFIPDDYLYGSIEQRKALLEGLMDTDGTNSGHSGGCSSFSTVSEKLADGVVDIVRSLGGRAKKTKNNGCIKLNGKDYFRVSMLFTDYKPFRIKRKLDKCGYAKHTFSSIVNIELVGNKLGRCIKVSNKDGLYVTDDYILTHNTTRTKLFIAFCISNDIDHTRKYFKNLTKDIANAKQNVTDIYNMFVKISSYYPEIFQKTDFKKEERMDSFTTYTGIKMRAGTVGTDQRGQLQEDARPDFIWFDDFETRKTLRSLVETKAIWDNMEEARTGLSKEGVAVYTCNYLSERGNVHKLLTPSDDKIILIVPIKKDGEPTWNAYTIEEINNIEYNTDDFAGEYLCVKPNTQILTKEGWKEISSVKVGDKVITHLNRERKVLNVFESNNENLLDITVNGEVVTITKNHPVLTVRGDVKDWVPAGELSVDDLICVIPRGKLSV